MNKEDNTRIPIGELTDIIDKCKGFIEESTLIIKNIEQNKSLISYPIPVAKIIELVKDEFEVDFTLKKRSRAIVSARYACAHLLKRFTKLSLNQIAEYIGVRDHSTVLYAIKTVNNLVETDRQYNLTIKKLENKLWEYHNELYDNNI
jgi:chromosomal replication initiator protein